MSHFIAEVINNLNLDESIAPLLDATESINKLLEKRK